jgi:hypothetical protein
MILKARRRLNVLVTTGKARLSEDDATLTPMTRDDLAALTVGCIGNPACMGRTYHVRDDSLGWPPPRPAAPAGG